MKRLICIGLLAAAAMLAQVAGVQRMVVCTDAGASDAYTCTPTPAITAFAQLNPSGGVPVKIRLVVGTANTGAATLDIDGGGALAAKSIVKYVGGAAQALADNDIRTGQAYELDYDATGDQFRILSLLGNGGSGGGGSTEVGWIPMGCYKLPVGLRVCEAGFEGTIQSSVDTGTAANDPVEVITNGSSGDKVVVSKQVPIQAFTNTVLYITFRSTSTSTVTFTPRTVCNANGAAISNTFTTGTAVNVTPGASGRRETAVIPLTSCASGELMRIAVQTNAVAVGLMGAALRFHN